MGGKDAELEELRAGVSCATLLERWLPPWRLDHRESTRRCLKYRRSAGEILLVNHGGHGWWDPTSSARGDVFALVQHLDPGLNFGQVRKLLRPFIGLSPDYMPAPHKHRNDAGKPSIAERWQARRPPWPGSPAWRYLTGRGEGQRALPDGILRHAIQLDSLREGPGASAWFAHRDHDGRLTGIEMRGPTYRGFSADGRKTLFRLPGGAAAPSRLAVCEAAIDALSLATLEGPHADTLYVAVAGGMGPETTRALELLLAEVASRPGAMLAAATDADAAGERYAARLSDMAAAAGMPSRRLVPPEGQKDWNEVLCAGRGACVV